MANSNRKLKKRAQELCGWPDTDSGRTKPNGDWCYAALCDFGSTGKMPKFVSVKWFSIVYRRQTWRKHHQRMENCNHEPHQRTLSINAQKT